MTRQAALYERGFAQLHDRTLDRPLADELTWLRDMKVTDHEATGGAGQLRARLGLQDGDSLLEAPFDGDRPIKTPTASCPTH